MADWNIGFGVVIDCTSYFKEENRRSPPPYTHRGNNTPVLVKLSVYFSVMSVPTVTKIKNQIIFYYTLSHKVGSVSNRNEYQMYFLGVKTAGA